MLELFLLIIFIHRIELKTAKPETNSISGLLNNHLLNINNFRNIYYKVALHKRVVSVSSLNVASSTA